MRSHNPKSFVENDIDFDLLPRLKVGRPRLTETTAFGAGYLAALGAGVVDYLEEISSGWQLDASFMPQIGESHRNGLVDRWHRAVRKVNED